MSKITTASHNLVPFALAAALAVAPALAPSAAFAQSATTTAPATHNMDHANSTNANANAPSERNPIMADNGDARASKIIGSSVYNDQNTKIGSIDDILIGKNDQLAAVISVGGFLGMGTKYVEVPYTQLKFGNTRENSDNRVVMPGASKNSLMSMSSFNYTHS